jgi:beta-glucosidase
MKYLNGGWSYNWQGENSDKYAADKFTILEALEKKNRQSKCTVCPGADLEKKMILQQKAVQLAQEATKIILCLAKKLY